MKSLQPTKGFNAKKIILLIVLISMPLIVMMLWISWYHATFNAYADDSKIAHANYNSLAGLYGKSEICRDKDSIFGQYALTCTDIYSFCSTNPPNINVGGSVDIDKTKDCEIYMNATRPFRNFFILSVVASLISSGIGIILCIRHRSLSMRSNNLSKDINHETHTRL